MGPLYGTQSVYSVVPHPASSESATALLIDTLGERCPLASTFTKRRFVGEQLTFARAYDVDFGDRLVFRVGMAPLRGEVGGAPRRIRHDDPDLRAGWGIGESAGAKMQHSIGEPGVTVA